MNLKKTVTIMRQILIVSVSIFFLSGCTKEQEIVHQLDCVVESVVYTDTGRRVTIDREKAIKNGYEYHFKVLNNDTVVVNDEDIYVKDKKMKFSYSLKRDKKIDSNMKFQFTKAFDNVKFLIVNKNIEYTYACSVNN